MRKAANGFLCMWQYIFYSRALCASKRRNCHDRSCVMATAPVRAYRTDGATRAEWLRHPPQAQCGQPWYAFASVSHRWVNDNPQSRENTMRAVLQHLFGKPFPKVRPAFLTNPATKRALELDAYSAELAIAVEFHGIQHYGWPNPFHATRARFEKQLQRDALKQRLCAEHGVTLIVIPHTVAREGIEEFLRRQLQPQLASMVLQMNQRAAASAGASHAETTSSPSSVSVDMELSTSACNGAESRGDGGGGGIVASPSDAPPGLGAKAEGAEGDVFGVCA